MKKYILPLVLLVFFSCNKDLDDVLIQETIDDIAANIEIIKKDDALYSYLGLVATDTDEEITDVGCIEFIYPFLLFQFDEQDEYVQQVSVLGNENFAFILSNLQDGHSIGLSYPISGNLIDGTLLSINNNEELQQSLDSCIEEELEIILGNCNAIIEECVWKVSESDPADSPYLSSFFALRSDGSVVFSVIQKDGGNDDEDLKEEDEANGNEEDEGEFREKVGTWIFYFIGPDLHININFGPEEEEKEEESGLVSELDTLKSDWNFDWRITYIDTDKIEIEKSYIQTATTENGSEETLVTEQITLEKECEKDTNPDESED